MYISQKQLLFLSGICHSIPFIQPPQFLLHRPFGAFGRVHFLVAKFPGGACPKPLVVERAYPVNFDAAVVSVVEIIVRRAENVRASEAHLQAFVLEAVVVWRQVGKRKASVLPRHLSGHDAAIGAAEPEYICKGKGFASGLQDAAMHLRLGGKVVRSIALRPG